MPEGNRVTENFVEVTYLGRAATGRHGFVEVDWDSLERRWVEKHGERYTSPDEVLERSAEYVKERLSDKMGASVVLINSDGVGYTGMEEDVPKGEATRLLEECLEECRTGLL